MTARWPLVRIDGRTQQLPPGDTLQLDAASGSRFPGGFSRWAAAKARGASSPARFAVIGDSNVAGEGAGSGPRGLTGGAAASFARRLAGLLGFQHASFFGDQNITVSPAVALSTYDPRLSLGSGWAPDASVSSIVGGRFLVAAGGSSGKLTFSPVSSVAGIRLWYPTLSGLNTALSVAVDGTTIDTINQSSSPSIAHRDYTVSPGMHTISIGAGASGSAFVSGIECWDGSAAPVLLQGGFCTARAVDLNVASNPWNSRPGATALAPDYALLYCTINDAIASTDVAAYYADTEALVRSLAATADGCLCVGFPASTAAVTSGRYDAYAQALRSIAADANWSYFDARAVLGRSYTVASAKGYAFDNYHPSPAGAQALADGLYAFLAPHL
ncbi:GDSL-type esterase/lipase family protein [Delftia sp. UME58]|uniref:GDSL-type esterase/lipase family protein n=1 Tax=Delftia sp. UME58 TaxID=1862322 RepID=UPI001603DAEE|nr:GDSL-type esterase/lipase family protein [Delftia sp. UME58]MBB1651702.1 hypothetical protein [Delftia sp. UME58]